MKIRDFDDLKDMVCWPHTMDDVNKFKCIAQLVELDKDWNYVFVLERSVQPCRHFHVRVMNNENAVFIGGDTSILQTNMNVHKAMIHVLAMGMARGVFNQNDGCGRLNVHVKLDRDGDYVAIAVGDGFYYQCANAWFCAARLRSRVLVRRCLLFKEAARAYRLRHGLARKVQRMWKRCVADPAYDVCRKRLKREFEELTG